MEGTFTTTDHLLLAEVGVETQTDESTKEVFNYLKALNESLSLLRTLPISHRLIKRSHEILLSGLSAARGARKKPGQYKSDQNWIGGYTIDKARYVPPPPAETEKCMDDLERYINRGEISQPEALIDLALVHYQLEAIHPFSDGNGRVGRMLVSLMAVHSGLLDIPILYMSPALENIKDNYIDLMFDVSTKGNWDDWLCFFFDRVCASCKETVQTVDRLIDLQTIYRERAAASSRSANVITIVDHLFERPALTVTDAATKLGVTYPAAKSTIDKLVEIGILAEHAGAYPKVYFAPEILKASKTPSDDNSTGGE